MRDTLQEILLPRCRAQCIFCKHTEEKVTPKKTMLMLLPATALTCWSPYSRRSTCLRCTPAAEMDARMMAAYTYTTEGG
jgi:hypothetical protein